MSNTCPCLCAECFVKGGEDKNIPLLKDVFEAFPKTPINIDIKVNDDTLIRKVCALDNRKPLLQLYI